MTISMSLTNSPDYYMSQNINSNSHCCNGASNSSSAYS